MIADLRHAGVEDKKIIRCPTPSDLVGASTSEFIWHINSGANNSGKKRILFISIFSQIFPTMETIASGLMHNEEFELFGIYLFRKPADNAPFDHYCYCGGSLMLLSNILRQIRHVDLIYIQGHALWSFLIFLVRGVRKEIKVVHEVYDWALHFLDGSKVIPDEEQIYSEAEVHIMRAAEDYIRNDIDGFIYKDGGGDVEKTFSMSRSPSIQFLPYYPSAWMRSTQRKKSDPIKLVFAGTIAPNLAPKMFEDVKLLPIAKNLTHQGFHVTLYNSTIYNQQKLNKHFADYIGEMENNPLFIFNAGIPLPGIIETMAGKYDYGIMLYDFSTTLVGDSQIKYGFPSKIFTYLASGLPMIISEEMENVADLVKRYQIGVVVSRSDINNLKSVIDNYSYDLLRMNVKKAQEELCLECHLPKFIDFIRRIMNS